MSALSRKVLESSLPIGAIERRRIENFQYLAAALTRWGLIPQAPSGTAPIGYPIAIDGRDWVRSHLFEKEIFAPVHWPTPDAVPAEFVQSRRLSARILTLPCDQRLSRPDLVRMVEAVERCLQ